MTVIQCKCNAAAIEEGMQTREKIGLLLSDVLLKEEQNPCFERCKAAMISCGRVKIPLPNEGCP
jgi:hypothetical protein